MGSEEVNISGKLVITTTGTEEGIWTIKPILTSPDIPSLPRSFRRVAIGHLFPLEYTSSRIIRECLGVNPVKSPTREEAQKKEVEREASNFLKKEVLPALGAPLRRILDCFH
jgi:hypothetical protein